MHNFSYVIAQL